MTATDLRPGDVIFGHDVRNGAQRTGAIVEVVPDTDPAQYVIENRRGQRFTVTWPGEWRRPGD